MRRGGRESGAPLRGDVPPKTPQGDEGGTAAANPAAPDTIGPYDGPRGPCPLGEFHHGGGYQLVRHDLRIRALEAELRTELDRRERLRQTNAALEVELDARLDDCQILATRAEKAEIEVERLKKAIAWLNFEDEGPDERTGDR